MCKVPTIVDMWRGSKIKQIGITQLGVVVFAFCLSAFSHSGEDHKKPREPQKPLQSNGIAQDPKLNAINDRYLELAAPIFRKKCFDCHSNLTHYPWYYGIPGARQLIDRDTREAKRHLDMSDGFPFKGHGSPVSDLKAIGESVRSNSMPPVRYRIFNIGSAVNSQEKEKILLWLEESQGLLLGK